MTHLRIKEDIRPVSDLKASSSEIVKQVTESGRPVILTRHGRGVVVIVSVDEYERFQQIAERLLLVESIREAEEDVSQGRVKPHAEIVAKWMSDEP